MQKQNLLEVLKKDGFSEEIIGAFSSVPREEFVPEEYLSQAYSNIALPLDFPGATISQPFTIAFMLSLLELSSGQKILEIGSGSGYVIALLSEIVSDGKIYGLEVIKRLADKSRKHFKGKDNITIVHSDGKKGFEEHAPYDRILISAACNEVPVHLLSQLSENGVLVVPVGYSIMKIKKIDGKIEEAEFQGFSFVPLI